MKNIKIGVGLLFILALFTLMLILSSGLSLYFLKNNNHDIHALNYNAGEQKALNATRDSIVRIRTLIDASVQARIHNDQIDVAQVGDSISQELQKADEQFQTFVRIPGLTSQHPELGEKMQNIYEQQIGIIAKNAGLLKTISDPQALKQAIADNSAATLDARTLWDKEYQSYMSATQSNLETVVKVSNRSYNLAFVVMTLMLVIAVALFFIIHFWLRAILLSPLKRVAHHFEEIGKGDLSAEIHIANRNEIGQLCAALQEMQAGLSETVTSIRQGVESINIGTQEIAAGNGDLSSRTEEQAAAVVETAASMEQISSTVKLNTDNARQASSMIQEATSIATEGEVQMQSMMSKMDAIRQSAQKMYEIISVIDGIAFQTNILALNAAVEAARAGQSGRGFAVVAGEVRSLAKRCTDSAKEITALINESTLYIQEGADLADKTSKTIGEISSAVGKVNVMMESIALASEEQSSGVEQIRVAITQMDQVTQQNAALVEEVATTASGVEEQANLLSRSVAVFKLKNNF